MEEDHSMERGIPQEEIIAKGLGLGFDSLPVALDGLSLRSAKHHFDCKGMK